MRFERRTSWLLACGRVARAAPPRRGQGEAGRPRRPRCRRAPRRSWTASPSPKRTWRRRPAPKWAQFKAQEYAFKRELMDGAIGQKLLENEAKKRGITVAELRQQEVESKTEAVSETQAKEFYEQNKPALRHAQRAGGARPDPEGPRPAAPAAQLNEYVGDAQARGRACSVLLEPHRIQVDRLRRPVEGPGGRAGHDRRVLGLPVPVLRADPARAEARRGDLRQERARRLPRLPAAVQIHPNAAKAAEAGACAADQGKFWEMHDEMFANQQKLAVDDLKQHAKKVGLDGAAFDACLDSGKKAEEWKADTADGEKYGVRARRRVFINGRQLQGTPGFEQFAADHRRGAAAEGPAGAAEGPGSGAGRAGGARGPAGSQELAGQVRRPRRQLAVIEAGGPVEQRQARGQRGGEAPLVGAARPPRRTLFPPAVPPGRHPARDRLHHQHGRARAGARRGAVPAAPRARRPRARSPSSAATIAPRLPGRVASRELAPLRASAQAEPAEGPARLFDRPAVLVDALDRGASARIPAPRPRLRRPYRIPGRGSLAGAGRAASSARTTSRTSRKCSGP